LGTDLNLGLVDRQPHEQGSNRPTGEVGSADNEGGKAAQSGDRQSAQAARWAFVACVTRPKRLGKYSKIQWGAIL